MAYEFTEVEQTGNYCPSQWDAWDENGNYYYIRYRFAWLTVYVTEPTVVDFDSGLIKISDEIGRCVYHERHGVNQFDGVMTTDEMLSHIEGLVR
jgi:hypothetical protein